MRQPIRLMLMLVLQTEGRGRAAFFGEAAMFTAQLAGPDAAPEKVVTVLAEQAEVQKNRTKLRFTQ